MLRFIFEFFKNLFKSKSNTTGNYRPRSDVDYDLAINLLDDYDATLSPIDNYIEDDILKPSIFLDISSIKSPEPII